MGAMGAPFPPGTLSRRHLLLAAAASCVPLAGRAADICTPYELAQRYRDHVDRRLVIPADQVGLYCGALEEDLIDHEDALRQPQYLLMVDSNPNVQAALLFWRLMPGHHQLIGASPVSTAGPVPPSRLNCAQGLYDQARVRPAAAVARGSRRIYEFESRGDAGPARSHRQLQARAAQGRSAQSLGSALSDGCILLPASLIAFLDEYGVLDAAAHAGNGRANRAVLPFPGRYLLMLDSDRDDRPPWSPCPAAHESAASEPAPA
jgi:hypothetical protein